MEGTGRVRSRRMKAKRKRRTGKNARGWNKNKDPRIIPDVIKRDGAQFNSETPEMVKEENTGALQRLLNFGYFI